MSTAPQPKSENTAVTQSAIIAVLIVGMYFLHDLAQNVTHEIEPTALLALGFVILASTTLAGLLEYTKLPHITGYMIAGLAFGPSVAHVLSDATASFPPFDKGVLNETVISQLSLLDTWAVALIALTAGGELRIEGLKRGFRAISSIAGFQFISVMVAVTAFIVAISGAIPGIVLPGLPPMNAMTAVALGAMVASISFATSPAATIAVMNETRARGPMGRLVLSTVVLKDVLVVVTFAVAHVIAAQLLGIEAIEGGLVAYLSKHIGASIIAGVALGGLMSVFLRWVADDAFPLLLFLVGFIAVAAFVAQAMGWDPVLLFLAAGFTVANFSSGGHKLIESVEKLSLPVYVVFFTLAGAKLHLEDLVSVAVFAFALVGVRALAIWFGVKAGARFGNADEATQRYGWLGFVSQAGVAISLAGIVANSFGTIGASIETLIIGAVALNEVVGPVLFKVALGLAGEVETDKTGDADDPGRISVKPPQMIADEAAGAPPRLQPWPEHFGRQDLWGAPFHSKTPELDARVQELGADLQGLVREVSAGPLRDYRTESERYLRDLRREFLRHHRRLLVQARAEDASSEQLTPMLRTAQFELAAHWRGIVLGRSLTLGKQEWSPAAMVESLDMIVESLPETMSALHEDVSFQSRDSETLWQSLGRASLRLSRWWRDAFSQPPPRRNIPLKALARFHLSGAAPARLEGLAALFVEADRHLAARTRSIFEGIAAGYDEIAKLIQSESVDMEAQLTELRTNVEEELELALDEARRIARDGTQRAAMALGGGFSKLKEDLPTFGTLDLPMSRRRSSKLFAARTRAIEALTEDLSGLRRAGSSGYSLLAMELELLGLEARVKDSVGDYVARLEDSVQRRAIAQADRVAEALTQALRNVEEELASPAVGVDLATSLKRVVEVAAKAAGEAAMVTSQLHADLDDEGRIAPTLDALVEPCRTLTPRYRVIAGQQQTGEWRLPTVVAEVEVPFQEIVLTYIESRIAPKLLENTRAFAEHVLPLANMLQELERLIAFNIELATSELEVVHDEPVPEQMHNLLREMLIGQLERSATALQEYREHANEWPDELANGMREVVPDTLEAPREDLSEGARSRSRLDAMRRAGPGRRSVDEIRGKQTRIEWAQELAVNALTALIGRRRLARWKRRIGITAQPPSVQISAGMFAAPKVAADLPLVYRRLFAADSMEAGDVLTGRNEEIHRADAALASNLKARLRSVALLGVDGLGKTAIANAIVRGRRWKNVRRVLLDKPTTITDLEPLFQDSPEGQLVVINGLHWMVSSGPGGFEPLRYFVNGIIAEGGRRRWLTHANHTFWNYATTIAPLRDAFPEIVELHPLDEPALRAAVIARHRLSGFGHAFDRGDGEFRFEDVITSAMGRRRRPYDLYFEQLHETTGGLVRDALRLWLASIKDIEGGEIVRVGEAPPGFYKKLSALPDEMLVTLYQIVRQGWLDAAGHARLFRVNESTAQAQLAHLAHLGLLSQRDGSFRIAVHLRGTLSRVFQDKGWIQ